VYLVSHITSPIATYSLSNACFSGIISENRLYLGGENYLKIYELTTSLTQPLTSVTQIKTGGDVYKILRVGHKLLLGESCGYLEVFNIKTSTFTSRYSFWLDLCIYDIIAIDDKNYLLASSCGLLKTTKKKVIKQYYKRLDWVASLCHVTHSLYLVGFRLGNSDKKLILWNQKKE